MVVNMNKVEKPKKIIVNLIVPSDFKKENEVILYDIIEEIGREKNLKLEIEIERQ
jgi:hypothetical protein